MTLIIQKPTGAKLNLAKTFTWNETVWNPSMISTALWLDAADASTITESSGAVSQWNDKSGNGHHGTQSVSNSRPIYTSATKSIDFDGIDDILVFETATRLIQNYSGLLHQFIIAEIEPNSSATIKRVFSYSGGASLGSTSFRAGIATLSNNINAYQRRFDLDSPALASSSYAAKSTNILQAIHDWGTANVSIRINGGAATTTATGQGAGATSNTVSNEVAMGSTVPTPSQSQQMKVYEYISIRAALSDATRQRIEGYLAHKWDLTANLPNDHPYKTVGPTP
jgi:hypothetical protein